MSLRSVTVFLVLLLEACAWSSDGDLSFNELGSSIETALVDWNVAGLAVAVVKDGRVEHLQGYGYRDIGDGSAVDGNTIFGIGSTSKTFGSAVIGVLIDEGVLDWDDRVIDHLPDFRVSDPYVTQALTLRDLLSHRSGVETNNIIFFGSVSRDDIVRKARHLAQVAGFRSRFGYHNVMILTAGQVAAKATGKDWDDVVKEKIIQPLGLQRTSTSTRDLDGYANVATPHHMIDGKLTTVPWLNVDQVGPAGCVNSTAADLATWMQVHLGDGTFEGDEIWSRDVQEAMHAPHAIMSPSTTGRLAEYSTFSLYGLGWMMHDYRGKKMVYHGGATDGMGSFLGLIPEEKLGVVVLQNTTQSGLLEAVAYRIIDAYLGAPAREWMELSPSRAARKPRAEPHDSSPTSAPSLSLESYVGVFHHPIYETVSVRLEQDRLVMHFDLYPSATLEHREGDTFAMQFDTRISVMWDVVFGSVLYVTFDVDADTEVKQLNIQYFGRFMPDRASPSRGAE